jgi:hypothetical protein
MTVYRGVVGLAYPGGAQPPGLNPRVENIPQLNESCAGFPEVLPWSCRETMVHYDMDFLNSASFFFFFFFLFLFSFFFSGC